MQGQRVQEQGQMQRQDGKSVRGQAGRQTGGLDLATCYHAKTNLEMI